MHRIAFATIGRFPNLTEDDRLMIEPLRRRNIEIVPLIWDEPSSSALNKFDLVVIRSCWNYHLKPLDFLNWTGAIERAGIPVWNPAKMIEWNHNKQYLQELRLRGIPVVSTLWFSKDEHANLRELFRRTGWKSAVVKPAVSATAYQTWIVSNEDAELHQSQFDSMLKESDMLVQELLAEVQALGEWSFIFFGGKYSHAVLKRAPAGEFRVQEEFGGKALPTNPPAELFKQAQSWIEMLNFDFLYARLDAVQTGGSLILMELELIEPSLYLSTDPKAAERFADEITVRMKKRT